MSARPIVNRARVLVERLEHTAACIPDLEIQQAFENIRNQWNTLMQRDWLLCQLQAIPQKWCEYETNFEDMVKWMNTVDKCRQHVSRRKIAGEFQSSPRRVQSSNFHH